MTALAAVFKREFRSYFTTPLAYVFLVIFLGLSSFLAFKANLYEARVATLRPFFRTLPPLFALLAPAVAMRSWAEERKTGTIELLFSLPIRTIEAILGKFLAGWAFFAVALVLTTPLVFSIDYLGDPDWGTVFTGYLGAFLMAGSYLAIGTFFSSLTKNQVICFVLGALVCSFLVYAGSPSVLSALAGWLPQRLLRFVESLSFLTHFEALQRGVVEIADLFAMAALTVGFLAASALMLEDRKAQ
jgi:ABC-2 type transport system permease protein